MEAYIIRVLEPHAKINLRKAMGMLGLVERYGAAALETAAVAALSTRRYRYREFKALLTHEEEVLCGEDDTREAALCDNGDFRFEGAGPGQYALVVEGEELRLVVPEVDLSNGP